MASTPTVYKTLLQTYYYTVGGYPSSKVFTFAPQTTPFTPSVECNYPQSIRCQLKPEEITLGASCLGNEIVAEKTGYMPKECFPPSFIDIWRPLNDEFIDIPSLGFPGTACIRGWTTACETVINRGSSQFLSQTWCCPPGGWACLTVKPGETPYRDCVSLLSTPTEVWVVNIKTTNGAESTLWSSWRKISLSDLPSSGPISVKHPPFPLYGGYAPGAGIKETEGEGGLSTGAIAGIVVGIVLAALALVGSGVFVCLRKRKQRRDERAEQAAGTAAAAAEADPYFKPPGYDTKQELPGHSPETREMHDMSPAPVELSSQTRIAEVDGSRPVELAS